jgi:hypothetical protein
MTEKPFLTPAEVAQRLGLGERTVGYWGAYGVGSDRFWGVAFGEGWAASDGAAR